MDSALRRLFDEDDQARRDFACWEAERARRLKAEQIANEECDEPLARMEARCQVERAAPDDGLIFKRTDNAFIPRPQPQAQTMDDESSRQWNDWAQKIAEAEAIKVSNQLVGDLDQFHASMEAKIAELKAKIADLEARLAGLGDLRREANDLNAEQRWN
jgi:uncharacterized protein YPO0396